MHENTVLHICRAERCEQIPRLNDGTVSTFAGAMARPSVVLQRKTVW